MLYHFTVFVFPSMVSITLPITWDNNQMYLKLHIELHEVNCVTWVLFDRDEKERHSVEWKFEILML